MTRNLAGMVLAVAAGSIAIAQETDPRHLVAEANRAFANGEYTTAIEGYLAAGEALPESPEVAYNQAVALYKLGDYTAAGEALNRALSTGNTRLEARAKFNLGNTAFAVALKRKSNPQQAIRLLKTAVGYYRDAFELDSGDDDAQTNAELAIRLIKDLLASPKAPPEGGQQQEGQEGAPDGTEGESSGEPQLDNQQPDDKKQQESQAETRTRMTPSEAMRLLQAVRDQQRQRREQLARRRHARRTPVEKDW